MNDLQYPTTGKLPAIGTPESILVAATRPTHAAALMSLLQAAGLEEDVQQQCLPGRPKLVSQESVGPITALADWLADQPETHLVMLIPLPSVAIARRLSDGVAPRDALAQWQKSAQAVLRIIRPIRRRVSLIFSEPALAEPKALFSTLSQRLQLDLDLEHIQADQQPPELPGAVLRMMAENAIWQTLEARNLASELEATALPLPAATTCQLPAIDEVFNEYRKSIDTPANAARELREENTLLLEQLQRVQQKIEAFNTEKKKIDQRLSSTEQIQKELEEARQLLAEEKKKTQTIQELEEENELLLQQLHHVQEELEHYYLQSQQQASAQDDSLDPLNAAHDTIRAIFNSYSWRLTRPLRWVQYVLGGARRPPADKRPLPDNLEDANHTIEALRSSKSWKITRPLRLFLNLFSREG